VTGAQPLWTRQLCWAELRDDISAFAADALRRYHPLSRDPDDWPTIALALTLGLPVWSQDEDLTTAGVEVFTTGGLLDALREAGHIE
jgi:predicted nucleic acid-binding protein